VFLQRSLFVAGLLLAGCGPPTSEPSTDAAGRADRLGVPRDTIVKLKQRLTIEDFDRQFAQFESVFWDPADTISLRKRIREQSLAEKRVLEIGTGTGLLSLCCVQAGAAHVVATDINPSAIANADYNAESLDYSPRLDLRFVSTDNPGAYAVIGDNEQFDLIISNPPWEDGKPEKYAEFAYYDEDFALLDSLLKDVRKHLTTGGRVWLAYGCVEAIRTAQRLAEKYSLNVAILDDRELGDLENLFLPGMLLEISPAKVAR
jgi:methylase of polypeptide subunit release factors